MKHKPILLKKLAKGNGGRSREVIGLIGTHRGAGVTHTGLMLAFYMGEELGMKTAFLECNTHMDMCLIQKAYEWNNEESDTFSYHRITCYKEVTQSGIPNILGEDYECIILDFGTDLACNKEEFLRCTRKIVVGGSSEWEALKLMQFTESSEAIKGSDTWKYVIPGAKERAIIRLKSDIKQSIYSVPLSEEPTRPDRNARTFFKELFRY